jgi:hypothetical protein
MLGGDPVPWLLSSDEPAARWVTLTAVLDRALRILLCWRRGREGCVRYSHPRTGRAAAALGFRRTAVGTRQPAFAPHLLNLLADMGVRAGDFDRIAALLARLPAADQPPGLLDVARVSLWARRTRGVEKPYQFGHGRAFKIIKWPPTWYGAYALLDTMARYPQLWRGGNADPADVISLAELAACLVAYNVSPEGTIIPRSTYRGFETYSFGQRKRPSPLATALLLAVLRRLDDLAPAAHAIDVAALASLKGGRGAAVPRTGLIARH